MKELIIKLDNGAFMPERGHAEDAGLDLKTPQDVTIQAGGSAAIDTGIHVVIPEGYYGKLESKSGLNVKHNIVSLGGVIDSGYEGSIVAKLYNLGNEDFAFHAGDKIVQLVIMPCETPKLIVVDEIESISERGTEGFGSTGR